MSFPFLSDPFDFNFFLESAISVKKQDNFRSPIHSRIVHASASEGESTSTRKSNDSEVVYQIMFKHDFRFYVGAIPLETEIGVNVRYSFFLHALAYISYFRAQKPRILN